MKENHLKQLGTLGQSIWLDYIRRDLITSGELRRLIEEDGLRGMTSNPSIFEKAIAHSHEYDADIRTMVLDGKNSKEIYESISQSDVQGAAREFRPVYNETDGKDGYVSLEVNPHLAHDTKGTITEARRLWAALKSPNVLIKVPATLEGLKAIQQLISEGINVNATLIFGLPRYRQVADAYITGLEECLAQGNPVHNVASVASFFVSRMDVLVDPMLEKIINYGSDNLQLAKQAHGQVAIVYAKSAYQIYKEIFSSDRFKRLTDHGARTQRLLWASTGTKNKDYSDVKYVEALIGADTVDTIPIETLDAYRDHGEPKVRIESYADGAYQVLQQVQLLGINMDKVTQQLEEEGVEKFTRSFDDIIEALTKARQSTPRKVKNSQPIAALFLDIGGVLLTDGWGHQFRELDAKVFKLDLAEINERHKMTVETYEIGKLTLEEYLNLVVFYRERTFSRAEFQKFMFEQSKPYPEMIELIRKLKEKYGLKIVVVSNEGRELNEYRIRNFKLDGLVDSFISSCYVHVRKPDADIFRIAMDTAQVPAQHIVYIEDTPMFVRIAENLGIRSILHTDYKSTCAKLASFGLKVAE